MSSAGLARCLQYYGGVLRIGCGVMCRPSGLVPQVVIPIAHDTVRAGRSDEDDVVVSDTLDLNGQRVAPGIQQHVEWGARFAPGFHHFVENSSDVCPANLRLSRQLVGNVGRHNHTLGLREGMTLEHTLYPRNNAPAPHQQSDHEHDECNYDGHSYSSRFHAALLFRRGHL